MQRVIHKTGENNFFYRDEYNSATIGTGQGIKFTYYGGLFKKTEKQVEGVVSKIGDGFIKISGRPFKKYQFEGISDIRLNF